MINGTFKEEKVADFVTKDNIIVVLCYFIDRVIGNDKDHDTDLFVRIKNSKSEPIRCNFTSDYLLRNHTVSITIISRSTFRHSSKYFHPSPFPMQFGYRHEGSCLHEDV